MSEKSQEYCLKWNEYQSHVAENFAQLLEAQSLVDVTFCAEGKRLHAHRIVLSACSPFLRELLNQAEEKHPVIILSEVKFEDVECVIQFVYHGELNVLGDQLTSVLRVGEELQIKALMELNDNLPTLDGKPQEEVYAEQPSSVAPENEQNLVSQDEVLEEDCPGVEVISFEESYEQSMEVSHKSPVPVVKGDEEKRRIRRREQQKKDYSEEALTAALEDLKRGRLLVETANAHGIPRSTLYARARNQSVPITITRHEHSGEHVQAAVRAVRDGASLQHASETFKIPKTVLWRRVQKENGGSSLGRRLRVKHPYDPEKKQQAIKALERGENLSKVSSQFQIPKTTLFREKARLVEEGRLPWNSLRRRGSDGFKQHRLSKAVQACKEGMMSQAVASFTFQVPKTTIWRRLQQGAKTQESKPLAPESEVDAAVAQLQHQPDYPFVGVTNQLPVTYIDDFSEASLIILTTGDSEGIELQEGKQIIVSTEATEEVNEDCASVTTEVVVSAAESVITNKDS